MQNQDTFLSDEQAGKIISKLGSEFAVVKNPDYIHPEFELYPLAPKIIHPVEQLCSYDRLMPPTYTLNLLFSSIFGEFRADYPNS